MIPTFKKGQKKNGCVSGDPGNKMGSEGWKKDFFFLPPHRKIGGILFYSCLSVHLSVCLSAQTSLENLTFSHYSLTNLLTRLIFGMKAHLINTHLLVPRSRSSAKVKVKYKGYISQKLAVSGAFVFHKHILC